MNQKATIALLREISKAIEEHSTEMCRIRDKINEMQKHQTVLGGKLAMLLRLMEPHEASE